MKIPTNFRSSDIGSAQDVTKLPSRHIFLTVTLIKMAGINLDAILKLECLLYLAAFSVHTFSPIG